MKVEVKNLDNHKVDEIDLNDDIFGLDYREDIVKLVVDWQRAKAMAGTHQTKTVSEVSGTTKKPFKQKGTGNARQGSLRSAQMRGGGVAHGPVTRSHATKLPKKVRKLGLKHALSQKINEGKLIILDNLSLNTPKTSEFVNILKNFGARSYFIIAGELVEDNLRYAMQNLNNVIVVPQIGANVYDIVKYDYVLLLKSAVSILEKRLV